jgi:hypothetical protein
MDESYQLFAPDVSSLLWSAGMCTLLLLLLVFAGWKLSSEGGQDKRKTVVLPMLFFFGALLAFMGAAGSTLTYFKFPVLEISDRHIRLDGKEYPRPRRDAVRTERVSGLGGESQILLLQIPTGKTYAFPDDRYPVNEIRRALHSS